MAIGLGIFQPSSIASGYNNDSNAYYRFMTNRNDGNYTNYTTSRWLNYTSDAQDKRVTKLLVYRDNSQSYQNSPYSLKPFSEAVRFYYNSGDYATIRNQLWGGSTTPAYATLKANVEAAIANGTLTEISSLPSDYGFTIDSANVVGSYEATYTCATRETIFHLYPIEDSSNNGFYLIYIPDDIWTYTYRNITYNLTNCSTDKANVSYFAQNIVLTPDSNCEFTSADDATVTGITPTSKMLDNGTIRINLPYGTNADTITINGIATATVPKATFSATCTNCTCSLANGSYEIGDTLTATFTPSNTASTSYDIDVSDVVFNITNVTLTVVNNTVVATWVHSEATTVNAIANYYINIDTSLIYNATCNYSDTDKIRLNTTYHIVVTSDNGFYFDTVPTISYRDYYGVLRTFDFSTDDTSESPTTYYYDLTLTNQSAYLSIEASAIVAPIETDVYGFVRMYKPTYQNLIDLASIRFTAQSNLDLGEYILSLKQMYINIPTPNSEQMKLGDYQSSIVSPIIEIQTITIDLGTVDVDYYFNNEMDYNNTDIQLYLPFIGFESLDVARVMNHTLHLYYKVNILKGDAVVFIDDENDMTVVNYTAKVGYDIPYILAPHYHVDVRGTLDIDATYLYGFEPYLIISRKTPYNTSAVNASKNEYVQLSTLTGYNEVEVLDCRIGATKEERDTLKDILRNGVIF